MGGHAGLRSSPEEMESESYAPVVGNMCPAYEDGGMDSLEIGVRQSRHSVRQICLGRGGLGDGKAACLPCQGSEIQVIGSNCKKSRIANVAAGATDTDSTPAGTGAGTDNTRDARKTRKDIQIAW